MVVFRLASGIYRHFGIRASEWLMVIPLLIWSRAMDTADGKFDASATFSSLSRLASEETWGMVCIFLGLARLFALIVNGTFAAFPYSPHLRGGTAVIAAIFWGQVALGTYGAWHSDETLGTAFAMYFTATAFEILNTFRAFADVGAMTREGSKHVRSPG